MPSTSLKQKKFMAAASHNPSFAKKAGIPVSVAKEFNQADKGKKFKEGGNVATKPKAGKTVKKMAFGGTSAPRSVRPPVRTSARPAASSVARSDGPGGRPMQRPQPIASQSQLKAAVQNSQPRGIQGGLQAGMKVPTQSPMQASMSGQAPSGNMQGGIQGNMQGSMKPSSDIPQGGQMGYRANNQAMGSPQTPPQVNSPAMVQSRMYPGPMGIQNGMGTPQLGGAQGGMAPTPTMKKGGKVKALNKLFKGKETYSEELKEGKAIKSGKLTPQQYAKGEKMEDSKKMKAGDKKMKSGGSCYAKGGVTRADGCVTKGHTKGKMMAMGGSCYAKGGVTRADGVATKGHTKGKMI